MLTKPEWSEDGELSVCDERLASITVGYSVSAVVPHSEGDKRQTIDFPAVQSGT